MHRAIPDSWLAAVLAGDEPPPLSGEDALNFPGSRLAALHFATPEGIAPLLARPEIQHIHHLALEESAGECLGAILDALVPDTLVSLTFQVREAYSSATGPETLPTICAAPAARALQRLQLRETLISGLSALADGPLSLDALVLIGRLPAAELAVLTRPAPALRSLRSLTITPDALSPTMAEGIAKSADLAEVEVLELPLVTGGGFDWGIDYSGKVFSTQFPAALAAIQALPGLKALRVTAPGYDTPALYLVTKLVIVDRLRGGLQITLAPAIFRDVLDFIRKDYAEHATWEVWCEEAEAILPRPALWVRSLHQRGIIAALGLDCVEPTITVDAEIIEFIDEHGVTDPELHGAELADLVAAWGEAALVAFLAAQCGCAVVLVSTDDGLAACDPARVAPEEIPAAVEAIWDAE